MSPKQWLALLGFYVSYLFFGASIFFHMEHQLETERREQALLARIDINQLLTTYTAPYDPELQKDILNKVSEYCEKPVTNFTEDKFVDPYVWNFYHAFFFSFTVCSTVGYGNISPNSTFGRIIMMFYALIGIPVNGILFAYLGEFFGATFVRLYRKYKQYKISTNINYVPRKLNLIAQISLYLAPGIIIFIFLPACLFTIFEEWPYSISVYYAFVTLTTVGFGDFVPTFQPHQEREFGIYFVFYQIFIMFWVIFGLGYLVMIMGFIARGMRSKRVAQLEHTLAVNIKQAQNRIWNNVSRDVGYLRQILNEVYMLRFKPVYNEPGEVLINSEQRSASCPDLTLYRSGSYIPKRRRAFSECYSSESDETLSKAMSMMSMARVQSDSDLSRIDRKRTFEGVNALVQPGELLAKVVTALGNFRPEDDGQSLLDVAISHRGSLVGVHGFSDSQILASERTLSGWSLPSSENNGPLKRRERACSEVGIPMPYDGESNPNEWTWSGSNTQIKELMRMRQKQKGKNDLYRASFGTQSFDPQQFAIPVPDTKLPAATNKTLLDRLNPFRKSRRDSKQPDEEFMPPRYADAMQNRRDSRTSLASRHYLSQTKHGRPSLFTISPPQEEPDQTLLETTTIADLIRAIELVHTSSSFENAAQMDAQLNFNSQAPRRKMGTASLTPPKVPSIMTLFPPNMMDGLSTSNNNTAMSVRDRRRGSLRPAIFNSIRHNPNRRQSSAIVPISSRNELPPPYTPQHVSPAQFKRRFSVRPSNLAIPPGQAPPPPPPLPPSQLTITPAAQVSSALHRKLSAKPTPLSRLAPLNSSARNILFRPKQLQLDDIGTSTLAVPGELRTRHSSLSNIYEKRADQVTRERNDSK